MKLAKDARRFASVIAMRREGAASGPPSPVLKLMAKDVRRLFVWRACETNDAWLRHNVHIVERRCLPMFGVAAFESGGEEGIRTLDTTFAVWRFSKALPSATRPPLRCGSYASNRPAGSNRKAAAKPGIAHSTQADRLN